MSKLNKNHSEKYFFNSNKQESSPGFSDTASSHNILNPHQEYHSAPRMPQHINYHKSGRHKEIFRQPLRSSSYHSNILRDSRVGNLVLPVAFSPKPVTAIPSLENSERKKKTDNLFLGDSFKFDRDKSKTYNNKLKNVKAFNPRRMRRGSVSYGNKPRVLKKYPPLAHFNSLPTHKTWPNASYIHCHDLFCNFSSKKPEKNTFFKYMSISKRECRDAKLIEALQIVSRNVQPPIHYFDHFCNFFMKKIETFELLSPLLATWTVRFVISTFFAIFKFLWYYVILEIHLVYNLGLLYYTFYQIPPVKYIVIGITLFWIKIIYELYRDILHRNDAAHTSNIPTEMSIAAAISASMGLILNIKAQDGYILRIWRFGDKDST